MFSPRDLMVTSTLVEVVCCCCCRSRRRARASSLERSREKSSQRYHRFIGRRGHPWLRGPRSHASREGRPHFQLLFYVEFIYLFTLEHTVVQCSSIVHISLSFFCVCITTFYSCSYVLTKITTPQKGTTEPPPSTERDLRIVAIPRVVNPRYARSKRKNIFNRARDRYRETERQRDRETE